MSNSSRLFQFGVGTDDLQGPHGDDSASDPITLGVPFTFFGTEYREIIVRVLLSHYVVVLLCIARAGEFKWFVII